MHKQADKYAYAYARYNNTHEEHMDMEKLAAAARSTGESRDNLVYSPLV